MVHWDFGDLVAEAFDQGRDETVHAMKGNQGFATLTAHRLERAPGVTYAILGEPAPHSIRDLALNPFEPGVPAFQSIATDQVSALIYLG